MSTRLTPLLLLAACSAPSPVREEPALPPPSSNIITASSQAAPKDTMILEAKLAVCEKFVHAMGEQNALNTLGFKSLLPPEPPATKPSADNVVGIWRSGYNPEVHRAGQKRVALYEERIHYGADGRVCGLQQSFELLGTGSNEKLKLVSTPFSGTWKLNGNTLVEDYSAGISPEALNSSGQKRRSRKITALTTLERKSDVDRYGLRFDSKWPNYFETVARAKVAGLREVDDNIETMKGDLPAWCFETDSKEKAEK